MGYSEIYEELHRAAKGNLIWEVIAVTPFYDIMVKLTNLTNLTTGASGKGDSDTCDLLFAVLRHACDVLRQTP